MKKTLLLLMIAGFFTLVSCKKDTSGPVIETPTTTDQLVVPAGFDWKTTQTLTVNIILPTEGEIQPLIITNRDGSIRYFRGYPENGSRTINTLITVPTYVNELRLSYNGTIGPNMVYISNQSLSFDFNSTNKTTTVVGCDLTGMASYSQGGWFQKASGGNVGSIRDAYFDEIYSGDLVIGDPDGYTITFNSTEDVENFRQGGGAAVLTQSYTNPDFRLGNMASQIIAARLNRDYSAAGKIGTNNNYNLGELVFADGDFQNMTVNDFLTMAEIALGGGSLNGHTAGDFATAAEIINLSFHEGTSNSGALTCPPDPTVEDPFIEVSSICVDPDVVFSISNTGDGAMIVSKNYTLYKNNIEIDNGSYQLDINQNITVTASGDDTDEFKLVVETPRDVTLEEIITGCGESGGGGGTDEQLSGTVAYEDLWPGKGDYDFNDLIIDYNFNINKDNNEFIQNITATFTIRAFGASYHNGFGFTLPTVAPSDIVSVTGYDIVNTTVFDIAGNGLEAGQSKATIIVYDDARRIMPQTTGGIGVNTQLEYDYIDPVTVVINIAFASNVITYSELNIGSFNPFIIVNTVVNGVPGERGLEVHLPNYPPSDLFDTNYFGQADDDSSIAEGRYFVTSNNLPWAINIADGFDWVIEFQDITGAYNWFADWAESGGTANNDWYKDFSGYRNDNLIYPTQVVK
jgi:LruC domain-containing protein